MTIANIKFARDAGANGAILAAIPISAHLKKKVSGRAPLHINPGDAAACGVCNGDIVRVFNARGACLAGAVVDPALMANVIVMPTGAWFDPADSSLEKAWQSECADPGHCHIQTRAGSRRAVCPG
ncbi:molybdopterin dinucleotide binding domain-containing protein [Verminephrobacter eiseniae]|uniref:molybdopterin dinucleotide binding domain-containing protein n=1 Tax=Verminephrobacter eiseniae TaxID=364317 RepID=UPI002238C1EA|nr:molybdopterin dinucleotide binding domain-containing protein [Verminephrobacter eiseniae]